MPLYAISRARVQYLGAVVPLFRFRHCLFESLMAAVHERDIRPNFYEDYNKPEKANVLQEPIMHEKILVKRYLEFMNNPFLAPLLTLSLNGDTVKFVEHFNRLDKSHCPFYSSYKVSLYDINQRKFIIEDTNGKDIYMVHYNGFVFGTNYPKLIVIREKEPEKQESKD